MTGKAKIPGTQDALDKLASALDDGYCAHGVYVGGCGIDWMCGYCEDGVSADEYAAIMAAQAKRRADRAWIACQLEAISAGSASLRTGDGAIVAALVTL